jgi:branched-subunit amino acid transport protein
MNYEGVLIGAAAFLIIGIFHPIVVKTEYHFGARVWPVFLVSGLACVVATLFIRNTLLAAVTGIFGFSALWSIRELFEQAERVRKGWFPANPKRQG